VRGEFKMTEARAVGMIRELMRDNPRLRNTIWWSVFIPIGQQSCRQPPFISDLPELIE
jgi:hypothetical protein